jgi:hypothetical protein
VTQLEIKASTFKGWQEFLASLIISMPLLHTLEVSKEKYTSVDSDNTKDLKGK